MAGDLRLLNEKVKLLERQFRDLQSELESLEADARESFEGAGEDIEKLELAVKEFGKASSPVAQDKKAVAKKMYERISQEDELKKEVEVFEKQKSVLKKRKGIGGV